MVVEAQTVEWVILLEVVVERQIFASLKTVYIIEFLLQEVEAATTLSDSDADLLVKEFARVVIGYVANGHNVDLGVLGTLSPKISAKAVDSEKDCTAQTISSIGVLYRSRQELADDAKAMSITMLSSSSSSATDGGDEGNDNGNDNGGGNNGDGGDLVG